MASSSNGDRVVVRRWHTRILSIAQLAMIATFPVAVGLGTGATWLVLVVALFMVVGVVRALRMAVIVDGDRISNRGPFRSTSCALDDCRHVYLWSPTPNRRAPRPVLTDEGRPLLSLTAVLTVMSSTAASTRGLVDEVAHATGVTILARGRGIPGVTLDGSAATVLTGHVCGAIAHDAAGGPPGPAGAAAPSTSSVAGVDGRNYLLRLIAPDESLPGHDHFLPGHGFSEAEADAGTTYSTADASWVAQVQRQRGPWRNFDTVELHAFDSYAEAAHHLDAVRRRLSGAT